MPTRLEMPPIMLPVPKSPQRPGICLDAFGSLLESICQATKKVKIMKNIFSKSPLRAAANHDPVKVPRSIPGVICLTTDQFTAPLAW
jgi:hypothetical protein